MRSGLLRGRGCKGRGGVRGGDLICLPHHAYLSKHDYYKIGMHAASSLSPTIGAVPLLREGPVATAGNQFVFRPHRRHPRQWLQPIAEVDHCFCPPLAQEAIVVSRCGTTAHRSLVWRTTPFPSFPHRHDIRSHLFPDPRPTPVHLETRIEELAVLSKGVSTQRIGSKVQLGYATGATSSAFANSILQNKRLLYGAPPPTPPCACLQHPASPPST